MSAHERTGWRDEALSRRHRTWGFNCPAVDIDFLMIEYDHGIAVAVIDYKMFAIGESPSLPGGSSIKALSYLSSPYGSLPFFVVFYRDDSVCCGYLIVGMNESAKSIQFPTNWLSELEYVRFLYQLRARPLPVELNLREFIRSPPLVPTV